MAYVTNRGAARSEPAKARLVLAPDLRLHESTIEQDIPALNYGETHTLEWRVTTELPGEQKIIMSIGDHVLQEATLPFTKTLLLPKEKYVPRPMPVRSDYEVCAYYFPGWNADAKWDCIRRVAPNRKPALGYYDEGNPACVDWQIKWAVENCISCFLVDWYWCDGQQHLTHWFDAYRKARYRDMLKVAIMWANHNPPNTHSAEDWRKVTQHWIDNYFNLPAYYKIDGKPALFIWAPSNVRNDLKGSDAVKKSMDESQEMAKKAGYGGITFVAMHSDFSKSDVQALTQEGYHGLTTYHEWGMDYNGGLKKMRYESVFKRASESWEAKDAAAGQLTYYPDMDTGWDSRPWHGDKAFRIEGRNPQLFEQLLQRAADFVGKKNTKTVILGPLNEWGEGSYIEPCLEYDFGMYEAVRNVFGGGNPKKWPINAAPSDIGLSPYEFPAHNPVTAWTFEGAQPGWTAMMGVTDLACADGALRFRTSQFGQANLSDRNWNDRLRRSISAGSRSIDGGDLVVILDLHKRRAIEKVVDRRSCDLCEVDTIGRALNRIGQRPGRQIPLKINLSVSLLHIQICGCAWSRHLTSNFVLGRRRNLGGWGCRRPRDLAGGAFVLGLRIVNVHPGFHGARQLLRILFMERGDHLSGRQMTTVHCHVLALGLRRHFGLILRDFVSGLSRLSLCQKHLRNSLSVSVHQTPTSLLFM